MIEQAKADLIQAKSRLERALANTPDDRINWSPAPTARTPIEQVVHAAESIGNIHGFLAGTPFLPANTAAADVHFRERESRYRTREEALALLEEKAAAFLAWLDTLTAEDLETIATLPFGMGQIPVGEGLRFPGMHTNDHAAQIDYLQTTYGDRNWHTGF